MIKRLYDKKYVYLGTVPANTDTQVHTLIAPT